MAKVSEFGRNIKSNREGDILTLTIDLSKSFGRSASGKSIIVATSSGNKPLGDGTFIGVNVYKQG